MSDPISAYERACASHDGSQLVLGSTPRPQGPVRCPDCGHYDDTDCGCTCCTAGMEH